MCKKVVSKLSGLFKRDRTPTVYFRGSRLERFFRYKYGGRLPFIRFFGAKIVYFFGGYNAERNIDWRSVNRVAFVCKGNINRSPYAEYYFKKYQGDAVSFGLDTTSGFPASSQAIINAKIRLIDLTTHLTSTLEQFEFEDGDLLVAFEPYQSKALIGMNIDRRIQVTLSGLWSKDICPYIQDPICREDEYFQACYLRIEQGVGGIIENLNVTV